MAAVSASTAALESLNEGLSLPRRLKNIRKVERKVGRLQEKYQSVAHRYAVEVKQKEGALLAESATFSARVSHQERTQASGGYVLSVPATPPGLWKRLREPTGDSRRLRPPSES